MPVLVRFIAVLLQHLQKIPSPDKRVPQKYEADSDDGGVQGKRKYIQIKECCLIGIN